MRLRLARVFMRGVGPASARYDPLVVDFRNAASEAEHSVLWLRNGGGKTTFERLVFHVVAWNFALRSVWPNVFSGVVNCLRRSSV